MKAYGFVLAYNEGRKFGRPFYLPHVLDALKEAEFRGIIDEAIMVDDGSTDETAKYAHQRGVTVLTHRNRRGEKVNRGKIGGFLTALDYTLRNGGDALLLTDADIGNFDPWYFDFMLTELFEYDMVRVHYRQGDMDCPIVYSGLRAIHLGGLEPLFDKNHPDYSIWSNMLRPMKLFSSGMTNGFGLEEYLEELIDCSTELDFGLNSRDRFAGACCANEIRAGIQIARSDLAVSLSSS